MAGVDVVAPGGMAAVDRPDIHQLANPGPDELVTIHVYSPPLTTISMYSTDVARAQPGDAAVLRAGDLS